MKVTNIYYSSNDKLLCFFKKCFSLHFFKKRISKKIFSKSVNIILYKDNLKPVSLFDVIFSSGAIIAPVGDKRERLLIHFVLALFLKFGLHYIYLLLELWNCWYFRWWLHDPGWPEWNSVPFWWGPGSAINSL